MNACLITNEFLNTNKFTEINQWLINSAKRYGIEMEVKTNAEILVMTHRATSSVQAYDFVLFWDKDVRLAEYLESLGCLVFNSSKAIEDWDDKSRTHIKLSMSKIPMPKTVIAPMTYPNIGYTNYDFLTEVEQDLGYPMVVKECFGSFGMQVYKVDTKDELLKLVEKIGTKPILFQEYIRTSAGKDIRIHVVGDQVVTSMFRYSVTGDFRANVTNGGKMKPYEPTEEEKDLAIQCTKALKLDFAGVDLLFGIDNSPLVCEVNSNAHFKNIYDCTGVNVADAIMEYILSKVGSKDKTEKR